MLNGVVNIFMCVFVSVCTYLPCADTPHCGGMVWLIYVCVCELCTYLACADPLWQNGVVHAHAHVSFIPTVFFLYSCMYA
jgi:hypothetical protein